MKKILVLVLFLILSFLNASAFQYNEEYSQGISRDANTSLKTLENQEVREIKNLTEYFRYLPVEVNRQWKPYTADSNYEVEVKFKVNKDGTISKPEIIRSTNERANNSVIKAVLSGAPYQPLPKSYTRPYVTAQVILEFKK